MSVSENRLLQIAFVVGALSGCGTSQTRLAEPIPAGRTEFTPLMLQASQEASAGHYAAADKLLADFTVRYPASVEATDAMFWRALYKLDPSNPSAGARDAGILLDGYVSSGATAHRAEAQALRRVATALEARAAAPVAPAGTKVEVVKVEDKARDEEIQRLKDELAKANAELDRIKRRLAQPTKP